MHMLHWLLALAFSSWFVSATPSALSAIEACTDQNVVAEWYIGKDNNVKVEEMSCATGAKVTRSVRPRQTNVTDVCGATCDTDCFTPSGGGPDPNDCLVIVDALLYDSQNTGPLFTIPSGTNNTIVMTYSTCKSFFVNQDVDTLEYCRSDWASVLDYVAFNCQATQNAHGGLCVALDQSWFIEVAAV